MEYFRGQQLEDTMNCSQKLPLCWIKTLLTYPFPSIAVHVHPQNKVGYVRTVSSVSVENVPLLDIEHTSILLHHLTRSPRKQGD